MTYLGAKILERTDSVQKKSVWVKAALTMTLFTSTTSTFAEEWSDTAISWRHGSTFSEPYNPNDISKNIFALTHAGGYSFGSQFFNVDLLESDSADPGAGTTGGAQEAYVVYRNTVDIGKVTGSPVKYGPMRDAGFTFGFDWNTKNDAGYGSKKRMLVIGPTLVMDVPGFFNLDLLALFESNDPNGIPNRYTYKTHAALSTEWGMPVGKIVSIPISFEGFGLFIASKGLNEFGGATSPETNIDAELMFDISSLFGTAQNTFRVGPEYQYWKNKFGNPSSVPGSLARTPMIRIDSHF